MNGGMEIAGARTWGRFNAQIAQSTVSVNGSMEGLDDSRV